MEVTRKEIKHLKGLEALKKTNDSEKAALTFIIPKKAGDVWLLTDFRKSNIQIVRKLYPLLKILDILMKLYARLETSSSTEVIQSNLNQYLRLLPNPIMLLVVYAVILMAN